jgi:hypothetical protein
VVCFKVQSQDFPGGTEKSQLLDQDSRAETLEYLLKVQRRKTTRKIHTKIELDKKIKVGKEGAEAIGSGRTHGACFPVTLTFSPADLVLH